jgi:hypothetical protein
VQGNLAAEDVFRPVDRIVVQKRSDAGKGIAHIRQPVAGGARKNIVLAAHAERQAIAGGDDDAGRPDLDIELVNLAGHQQLFLVMRMIGLPFGRFRRVEFAV